MIASIALYVVAACLELAGCYAFWAWHRGASAWWLVPGSLALLCFAFVLALTPPAHAGRSYATYGGIYIAAAIAWLALVEHGRPDMVDLAGAGLAIAGAALILAGPHH